jgi:hypothetical protein
MTRLGGRAALRRVYSMNGLTAGRGWGVVGAALCVLVLTGCENARQAMGMGKQSPDEFAVVARAPLTLPPDFGLRPPEPGAERPQEEVPRARARQILLGAGGNPNPDAAAAEGRYAKGEAALLQRAGALNTDPSIRQQVNAESTTEAAASRRFMDRILFWQEPQPPGTIIDAESESRRLREAAALGDPPNKGDVPVIERRERGWLEGILN